MYFFKLSKIRKDKTLNVVGKNQVNIYRLDQFKKCVIIYNFLFKNDHVYTLKFYLH